MANKIEDVSLYTKGVKGHYEVQFTDGHAGVALYDKSLNDVIKIMARLDRVVASMEWIEDK